MATPNPTASAHSLRYSARDGAVVGHDRGGFFNRPLYIANTNAFVLAGDRPILRFASGDTLHGTFFLGLTRQGRTHWLHQLGGVTMEFRPAHVVWHVRNRSLKGTTISLEVVALGDAVGFATRARVNGAHPGDHLVWAYGGAITWPEKNLNWELDPHPEPLLLRQPFDPALCAGNVARVRRHGFTLAAAKSSAHQTLGFCSAPERPSITTAAELETLLLTPSAGRTTQPLLFGQIDPHTTAEINWSFLRVDAKAKLNTGKPPAFAAGLARSTALASRLVVETPEPRLDTAASLLPAAIDGAWYPPVFRHGAMLWNVRFPGWRTLFGGTATGWHDRVLAEAKYFLRHQRKTSENSSTDADPEMLLSIPGKTSRFYGRGRIVEDQSIYNMQTQFFDQLIHAWRWTGDAELEALLRPALELHLEWIRDCFDPDGDGLYESVINVWPTDSVWYGGGGATEETSYAYRAHGAALELARRANDTAAIKRHQNVLARIKRAFQRKLWITEKGHAGLYREQSGLRRLHEDAWLYSIFLPIDAGLVEAAEAAASLHYTETSLQNDRMPAGGRRVWTSNFVPAIWSVREIWPGDNHHLALAYFQTGLAAQGWDIFRGTFIHGVFDQRVPGDFGALAGGTDFGDSSHMFARTLVEGLFGYTPDYPNNLVRLSPQFPAEWNRARLETSDFSLRYTRRGHTTTLAVELTRPAQLEICIPVCAKEIISVTTEGQPAYWTALPGFGCTVVHVQLPTTRRATLEIITGKPAPIFAPVQRQGRAGDTVSLVAAGAKIQSFADPQSALQEASLRDGAIIGRLRAAPGSCTLVARVLFGSTPQDRLFHVQISAPLPHTGKILRLPPARARWDCVDLSPVLNGDIRTIFQQAYLSPRPPTISARISTDGYSPWTFLYWKSGPPKILLDAVPALLKGADSRRLETRQGVPFAWPGESKNIAFTSRWDNWPRQVTVPVHRQGTAVWFLVCGSTNPMQCQIANAVFRMQFADGSEESLELVPPVNYWNLCAVKTNLLAPGQSSRFDYTAAEDAFCLPAELPQTVQLGENCRAMLLGWRLRPGVILKTVTLETLSAEVVVGLMGLTIMNPR